jgi:pimeloyl-ACP methyl ester carboxylesterase
MILGYDEAGEGDVLLLVHGFPIDRRIWGAQLAGLSGLRRVVAPDLRGRGKSPAEVTDWTIEELAEDLADTIRSLGVESVDLGGISMGGYIAFALLRAHPELVRSLILVSTRAGQDAPEYKTGREMTAERARKFGTRALAESMIDKLLTPNATREVRDRVLEMFDSVPGDASAADSIAMRDRADSTPMLASISIPTLVIQGKEEALLPAGSGQALADAIPGANLETVPGAGHFAPIENPEDFNAPVRTFLATTK